MATSAESEARKALQRMRRAAEKTLRELGALEGALERAEGEEFPVERYTEVRRHLDAVAGFVDEEAQRLQEKILHSGGLEPGRVRRSGGV
jgi:hypothetical protein